MFLNRSALISATGILLAGGKSSRMGKNKAFLEYNGVTLIERSLAVLKNIFAEVIISGEEVTYGHLGVKTVADKVKDQGPLAGLARGLQEAKYDLCFFAACDMPYLDEHGIRFLYAFSADFDIVAPKSEKGVHPLHAFYHRRCLPKVETNLSLGKRRLLDLYPDCNVCYVGERELEKNGLSSSIFANINTPEEWEEINITPQ